MGAQAMTAQPTYAQAAQPVYAQVAQPAYAQPAYTGSAYGQPAQPVFVQPAQPACAQTAYGQPGIQPAYTQPAKHSGVGMGIMVGGAAVASAAGLVGGMLLEEALSHHSHHSHHRHNDFMQVPMMSTGW